MASVTGTPLHYFLQTSRGFASGEALKQNETRFLAKVGDRQVSFGQTWAELMSFALPPRRPRRRRRADNKLGRPIADKRKGHPRKHPAQKTDRRVDRSAPERNRIWRSRRAQDDERLVVEKVWQNKCHQYEKCRGPRVFRGIGDFTFAHRASAFSGEAGCVCPPLKIYLLINQQRDRQPICRIAISGHCLKKICS